MLQRGYAYLLLEIAVEGSRLREIQTFTNLIYHEVRVLQQHFGLCCCGAVQPVHHREARLLAYHP